MKTFLTAIISDGKQAKVTAKAIGDKVEGVGGKVEEVGDKVQCVDDKVQMVIDGARVLSSQLLNHPNIYSSGGEEARVAVKETKLISQQTSIGMDEIKCS